MFRGIENIEIRNKGDNSLREVAVFFNEKLQENYNNFKKTSENENTIENKGNLSPMTIFDGRWGSGKTYFIDFFIKNIIESEEKDNSIFKDYIYIDALEIVDDENIIYSFLYSLYKKNREVSEKILDFSYVVASKGINAIATISNIISGTKIPEIRDKGITKEDLKISKPTLVFIDNIERIGNDSKVILRLIHKLRKIDNLYFILVTNIHALQSEQKSNDIEYPIYKFIGTPYFTYHLSYSDMLQNIGRNNPDVKFYGKELLIVDEILNNIDSNEQWTIREFANWLNNVDYLKHHNLFDRLKEFGSIANLNPTKYFDTIYNDELKEYTKGLIEIKRNLALIRKYITERIIPDKYENDKSKSFNLINENGLLTYGGGKIYIDLRRDKYYKIDFDWTYKLCLLANDLVISKGHSLASVEHEFTYIETEKIIKNKFKEVFDSHVLELMLYFYKEKEIFKVNEVKANMAKWIEGIKNRILYFKENILELGKEMEMKKKEFDSKEIKFNDLHDLIKTEETINELNSDCKGNTKITNAKKNKELLRIELDNLNRELKVNISKIDAYNRNAKLLTSIINSNFFSVLNENLENIDGIDDAIKLNETEEINLVNNDIEKNKDLIVKRLFNIKDI